MNKKSKIIIILVFILITISIIISSIILNYKGKRKVIDSSVKFENSKNGVHHLLKTIENVNY